MTLKELEQRFIEAKQHDYDFIGVKIYMEGFDEDEIIINPQENFNTKLAYYKRAYNEDCTLKTFNGIKIVNCVCGDSFQEIQERMNIK